VVGIRPAKVLAVVDIELLRHWINRVTALLQRVVDLERRLDEISVQRHLRLAGNNRKQDPGTTKLDTEYAITERQFMVALAVLRQWTDRATLEEAHDLVVDVQARLDLAIELNDNYRKALAVLELWTVLGQPTADGLTLDEAQSRAEALAAEIEMQLALARRQLPLSAEIIIK